MEITKKSNGMYEMVIKATEGDIKYILAKLNYILDISPIDGLVLESSSIDSEKLTLMFGGDIESETELKYIITSLVGVPTNKEMDLQ